MALRIHALIACYVSLLPLALFGQDALLNRLQPAAATAVDRAVNTEMQRQMAVGIAVGIVQDGKIAYLQGYGTADREHGTPVTSQTVFNWASNSKPLAAVIAMQLVEAKALDLDADVCAYVPEFPSKGAVITTRQLLCHQSGIPHYSNGPIVPTEVAYREPLPFLDPLKSLNKFNRSPLIFEPGTKVDYSSYAYVLLSAVIQRAGKQPFVEQVERRIAQPLNMASLQLDMDTKNQPHWAAGYVKDEEGRIVRAPEEAHYWKHGAGGFKSNVADFARWAEGLLNRRLTSEASESAMWTRQCLKDGQQTNFGLGFQLDNGGLEVGHGGSQPETRTQLLLYPRTKSGVVVMCNCSFVSAKAVAVAVAESLGWNGRPRARNLGISIGVLPPGEWNAITDVRGVSVGHRSVINGSDVRTGVTTVLAHAGNLFQSKVPAAVHVANGFGKFVGSTQIDELGVLETPIVLTNTLSTFAAADAVVAWSLRQPGNEDVRSVNPVVGECNDGYLNDIRGQHVRAADVLEAIRNAKSGAVAEGCVGAGVGTRCLGWKGGIGTSSRKLPQKLGGYTVGVLVQTNFDGQLVIAGAPVGQELGRFYLKGEVTRQEHGSCIVVVATDAPLDARQLGRLAKRATLGLAAVGSPITHGSGDYILAFSTADSVRQSFASDRAEETRTTLRDDRMSPLFQAVREAAEEAVVNSLLKATTTSGYQGHLVEAIDPDEVVKVCRNFGALPKQ